MVAMKKYHKLNRNCQKNFQGERSSVYVCQIEGHHFIINQSIIITEMVPLHVRIGDFESASLINHAFRDYRVRADKFQLSKCNARIHTGFCVG